MLFTGAVLFISVVVASLLATALTRRAVKKLIGQREREERASAIATLIDASTEAAVWNSLTISEQVLVDRAVGQADIHVRLLPVKGAQLAADWSAHQLAELKRNSSTYGSDLGPVVHEFRDRLLEWQAKPGRAKRIFEDDLERWQFDRTGTAPTGASVFPVETPTAASPVQGSPSGTVTPATETPEPSAWAPQSTTTPVNAEPAPPTTPLPQGQAATETIAEQTADTTSTAATAVADSTHAVPTEAITPHTDSESPEKLLNDVAALESNLPDRDKNTPDPL